MANPPKVNYHGPSPDDLAKVSNAAYLNSILPYLQDEFSRMEAEVKNRVFTAINSGKFTPEEAEAAWREIHAYHRLLKRITTRIRSGQTVGEKNAASMAIGVTPNG